MNKFTIYYIYPDGDDFQRTVRSSSLPLLLQTAFKFIEAREFDPEASFVNVTVSDCDCDVLDFKFYLMSEEE